MPRKTDRQQATDALSHAFLTQLLIEAEANLDDNSDSDLDIDEGDSSLGSDSDDNTLLSHTLLEALAQIHAHRFINERREIKKSGIQLYLLLHEWKYSDPGIFCLYLRMTPGCFDKLVDVLHPHAAFHNKSSNIQMPVEMQVAIALYCFRHYGNAASTIKVVLWSGVGYGTVCLVTRRVMRACCDESFRRSSMRWPDDAAKEQAKLWVEENSCSAWQNGWLMVDGTLVPLYACPAFYGNVFFDRKSNYSLNVQVSH